MIHIIGAGLAGSEAAWQAASRGVAVRLYEMRPVRPTAVHKTAGLAELVCSNSFRGDKLDNAVGLLKEEMRRLGSIVMRAADAARVPAGAALAVDRDRFSQAVTEAISSHPLITVVREEVLRVPRDLADPVIVATGPLTSDGLSRDIASLVGADHLYFYDAISPIVLADTIDMSKVFRASRWGRSLRAEAPASADGLAHDTRNPKGGGGVDRPTPKAEAGCAVDDGEGDYLNCPMDAHEYARFYDALVAAEKAGIHEFDNPKFFEGCLPIEVMAARGIDTLRFGPMKPVGLVDPRTGREPCAVVQLRQDNLAGDHYSLVGFQTQMKWGDQAKVLRLIPGLGTAEFVRFGMIHRNTYINGPTVLRETWQTKIDDRLFFAGQISGVEGYVESAASGLLAGRNAAALVQGQPPSVPPRTTAIGALAYYVSHANPAHYDPSNITFGILAPIDDRLVRQLSRAGEASTQERLRPARAAGAGGGAPAHREMWGPASTKKHARKIALSTRALADLQAWIEEVDRQAVPR